MKGVALTPDFWVSGQLWPEDMAVLAAAGVRLVLNNRPDGEQPGQPDTATLAEAAAAAGLGYVFVPLGGAGVSAALVEEMARALASVAGPVQAFCRSGTRSTLLWACVQVKNGAMIDPVLAVAAQAGYDLSGLRTLVQSFAQGTQAP